MNLMDERLYGEKLLAEARLETAPNPNPDRDYIVELLCPEFTCLCPRSGFPDFATLHISYIPDELIVELKSLKLYINSFREKKMFHEKAVNLILDDLVKACSPRQMEVVGEFNVRGNIQTTIRANHVKREG